MLAQIGTQRALDERFLNAEKFSNCPSVTGTLRSKALAQVAGQVPHDATDALQLRHVDAEVHPVDALALEHDVVAQHFADAVWSFHARLRSSTASSDPV